VMGGSHWMPHTQSERTCEPVVRVCVVCVWCAGACVERWWNLGGPGVVDDAVDGDSLGGIPLEDARDQVRKLCMTSGACGSQQATRVRVWTCEGVRPRYPRTRRCRPLRPRRRAQSRRARCAVGPRRGGSPRPGRRASRPCSRYPRESPRSPVLAQRAHHVLLGVS
jgi:hypothetical protein